MSNISSKNVAQSADNDKEETIDFNDIPKDVCDQCSLKNDQSKIIAKSNLANFSNNLTLNTAGAQQQWNFVEYLEISTTTSKYPGQTYLIMKDVTLYGGHLPYQTQKHRLDFLKGAVRVTEWTNKGWFCYCMMLKKAAAINCCWLFPHYCQSKPCFAKQMGFLMCWSADRLQYRSTTQVSR